MALRMHHTSAHTVQWCFGTQCKVIVPSVVTVTRPARSTHHMHVTVLEVESPARLMVGTQQQACEVSCHRTHCRPAEETDAAAATPAWHAGPADFGGGWHGAKALSNVKDGGARNVCNVPLLVLHTSIVNVVLQWSQQQRMSRNHLLLVLVVEHPTNLTRGPC